MDDEVITWNLKGPKKMKKRRELNALIKNNLKYKSLVKTSALVDDDGNRFNLTRYVSSNGSRRSTGGTSGLLRHQNDYDTSSDNEEFYFSANKSVLREKKRNYYCNIVKMILIGLLITFGLLVGAIFLFSYGKFHDIVNELKRDVQFKNEANQKNINDLKQKLNEYDVLLKQFKTFDNRLFELEKNMSIYQKSTNSGMLNLDEKNTEWRNAVNGEKLAMNNDEYNSKAKNKASNREKRSLNHTKSSILIKYLLENKLKSLTNQQQQPNNIAAPAN